MSFIPRSPYLPKVNGGGSGSSTYSFSWSVFFFGCEGLPLKQELKLLYI